MCGIVGLFLKNPAMEPQLGELLSRMLSTMCERGPDSAGFRRLWLRRRRAFEDHAAVGEGC